MLNCWSQRIVFLALFSFSWGLMSTCKGTADPSDDDGLRLDVPTRTDKCGDGRSIRYSAGDAFPSSKHFEVPGINVSCLFVDLSTWARKFRRNSRFTTRKYRSVICNKRLAYCLCCFVFFSFWDTFWDNRERNIRLKNYKMLSQDHTFWKNIASLLMHCLEHEKVNQKQEHELQRREKKRAFFFLQPQ